MLSAVPQLAILVLETSKKPSEEFEGLKLHTCIAGTGAHADSGAPVIS